MSIELGFQSSFMRKLLQLMESYPHSFLIADIDVSLTNSSCFESLLIKGTKKSVHVVCVHDGSVSIQENWEGVFYAEHPTPEQVLNTIVRILDGSN